MIEIKSFISLDDSEISLVRDLETIVNRKDNLNSTISINSEYNIVSDLPTIYLLYLDHQLVSVLSIFMPKLTEVEISGFTHPDFRHQGYFSKLLDQFKTKIIKYGLIDLLFICEYQSIEGVRFVQSLNANYEYSEYELTFNHHQFQSLPEINSDIIVEVSSTKDLERLIEIYQHTFNIPTEESRPMVMKTLNSERKTQFNAILNDIIIGTCAVSLNVDSTYILGVAIDTPYQSKGYGKVFLIKVIQELLKQNINNLMIEVDSNNANAYQLYRHIGFDKRSEFQYYRLKMDQVKEEE
jgi:ribosomal protein S18 acetylase RimI-like enzyme